MELSQKVKKAVFTIKNKKEHRYDDQNAGKYLKRIFISGLLSLILLYIIIYTLPQTVLDVSSLLEYTTIVALVIFLFVLVFRYFAILVMAFLYINEYTYKPTTGFFPFVSIIVPVYNEGVVVEDSVKSLLGLNYSNYEIIIVNDGSKDNTQEVAESLVGYQKGVSSDIKVSLINKPNGGKAQALNAGIKYSNAEIVLCPAATPQGTTLAGGSVLFPQPVRQPAAMALGIVSVSPCGSDAVLTGIKLLVCTRVVAHIHH